MEWGIEAGNSGACSYVKTRAIEVLVDPLRYQGELLKKGKKVEHQREYFSKRTWGS